MATRSSAATATSIELDDVELVSMMPKTDRPASIGSAGPSGRPLGTTPETATPTATAPVSEGRPPLSLTATWILIIQLCGNNFINSFSTGMLMVCLPVMARDLALPDNLLLWPTSVTSLASASCQLISGSLSDTIGPRRFNTTGSFLQSMFIIATGLAKNDVQLITFRALQGVATSMFTTSGRAMLSTNIARGRLRNFAFSAMVLAFPLGAGLGLVMGGIYADRSSWRTGYLSSGALGLLLSLTSIWTLPPNPHKEDSLHAMVARLRKEVDWLGVAIGSASVTILSYVLAVLAANVHDIRQPGNIALLTVSLALIPAFVTWMGYRERHQQAALIPNALWKDSSFTSVCVMIALSNAAQSCLTFFVSLFFQEVQMLSPFQASIRMLPQAAVSSLMCLFVGLFVDKVTPYLSIVISMALCSLSPLLMALTNPAWPYWYMAFWAQLLGPLSIDVMFVVGFLVVSDAFSGQAQARASAVFSTFAQLGAALGLCIMSVISNSVTERADRQSQADATAALLSGYRASFWTQFAWIAVSCAIGAAGLRKLKQVGTKND